MTEQEWAEIALDDRPATEKLLHYWDRLPHWARLMLAGQVTADALHYIECDAAENHQRYSVEDYLTIRGLLTGMQSRLCFQSAEAYLKTGEADLEMSMPGSRELKLGLRHSGKVN